MNDNRSSEEQAGHLPSCRKPSSRPTQSRGSEPRAATSPVLTDWESFLVRVQQRNTLSRRDQLVSDLSKRCLQWGRVGMCEVRGLDQKSWGPDVGRNRGSLFPGPRQRAPGREGLGGQQAWAGSKPSSQRAVSPAGLFLRGSCWLRLGPVLPASGHKDTSTPLGGFELGARSWGRSEAHLKGSNQGPWR